MKVEIDYLSTIEQFNHMKNSGGMYYVTVIVDTTINRIVASSTLLLERKFIRGCAIVSDLTFYSSKNVALNHQI